jgi:peptide chain release factor subunit 1
VALITEAAIRELAGQRGRKAPITSCYLDVDGRRVVRQKDLEHEVEILLKGARAQADGDASVYRDLERIDRYVRDDLDRSRVRGVAIFACSADGMWRVVELPVPVRTRVSINHVPAVGQLESVVQEHEPIGVLMADRQRARMFVFALGELVERSELFEQLPRETDTPGTRDRGGDHPEIVTPSSTSGTPRRWRSPCGASTRSRTWRSPRPTTWRASSRPTCTPTSGSASPAGCRCR